jgi:hypothetical protein
MPNPPAPQPAFLIGCHRAGTTLARYLLDAHPNIACPPESKFIAGLHAFYEYPQAIGALGSLNFSKQRVRSELRRIVETVLGEYTRAQGKIRWVDKTPNYYRILPFLDDLFEGSACFLFITRHPLDCAASLSAMYDARDTFNDPEIARSVGCRGTGLTAWTAYWNEVYSTLLGFRESRRTQCLIFRYEDLVRDPETTLRRLLSFLGEDMAHDLIATAFRMHHTPGYEDAGIRDSAGVVTNRIGQWKSWPQAHLQACWSRVAPTARLLGYDLT